MKTILLDADMIFTLELQFNNQARRKPHLPNRNTSLIVRVSLSPRIDHQGLALWAFDHNNMNEAPRALSSPSSRPPLALTRMCLPCH